MYTYIEHLQLLCYRDARLSGPIFWCFVSLGAEPMKQSK